MANKPLAWTQSSILHLQLLGRIPRWNFENSCTSKASVAPFHQGSEFEQALSVHSKSPGNSNLLLFRSAQLSHIRVFHRRCSIPCLAARSALFASQSFSTRRLRSGSSTSALLWLSWNCSKQPSIATHSSKPKSTSTRAHSSFPDVRHQPTKQHYYPRPPTSSRR